MSSTSDGGQAAWERQRAAAAERQGPAEGRRERAVPLYRDAGVVLRTIRLGEADRIVTFLTEGRGKVRAVAKGVRKTKSQLRQPARTDQPRRARSSTRGASSTP